MLQMFFRFVTSRAALTEVVVDPTFFQHCRDIGIQRLRRAADMSKYPDLKTLADAIGLHLRVGRKGLRASLAHDISDYFHQPWSLLRGPQHPKSA